MPGPKESFPIDVVQSQGGLAFCCTACSYEEEAVEADAFVRVGPAYAISEVGLCWDCLARLHNRLSAFLRQEGRIESTEASDGG